MKSLIRFKLVSKHWHSLITDPHFCRLRNPNPNPAIGLFLHLINFTIFPGIQYVLFSPNQATKQPLRTLSFTNDNSRIGILQSCNGLLLCCSFHSRPVHSQKYYVYNPTTTRFSTLPEFGRVSRDIRGMHLAFDPAKSPHYKVVYVTRQGLDRYQIELYSSERGTWRKCALPTAAHINFTKGVYWNGSIHWLSNRHCDSLYFNVENEIGGSFPAPPQQQWDRRTGLYFGESCDHLHYMDVCRGQVELDVYEVKRDYSEWFVKYRVDLGGVAASYPEMMRKREYSEWDEYVFSIFCVIRGEKEDEDDESFLVLQIPGRVVRYDLVCGTFRTIHEFTDAEEEVNNPFPRLRYQGTNGFQHIESLCCV